MLHSSPWIVAMHCMHRLLKRAPPARQHLWTTQKIRCQVPLQQRSRYVCQSGNDVAQDDVPNLADFSTSSWNSHWNSVSKTMGSLTLVHVGSFTPFRFLRLKVAKHRRVIRRD